MAQDLCPRFLDYFGMGHFHHKVRVPRRGESGEGLGEPSGLPSPDFFMLHPGLGGETG